MVSGRLLTADDLAALLGVGRDWIYAETRAGRIPHIRLGRYRRYRAESIDEWLEGLEYGSRVGATKRPRDAPTSGAMAQEE